jgi:hypothetical protein
MSWILQNRRVTPGASQSLASVPLRGMGASRPGTRDHPQEGMPMERQHVTVKFSIWQWPLKQKLLERSFLGFKGLTAVVMKSSIFWDITLCSPLKVTWYFGGTCHLHLQGQRICQARHQHETDSKQSSSTLKIEARYMFLQNVGWLSTDNTALYPRRQKSSELLNLLYSHNANLY